MAKASGSKSKHVDSAPMLTVLAQHLLLVASVFKYFKNWYLEKCIAKLPLLVFVFIVLINVFIQNLGDVMHFNLNIFSKNSTLWGSPVQSSAREKDSAAQRADVSPVKGWKAH